MAKRLIGETIFKEVHDCARGISWCNLQPERIDGRNTYFIYCRAPRGVSMIHGKCRGARVKFNVLPPQLMAGHWPE